MHILPIGFRENRHWLTPLLLALSGKTPPPWLHAYLREEEKLRTSAPEESPAELRACSLALRQFTDKGPGQPGAPPAATDRLYKPPPPVQLSHKSLRRQPCAKKNNSAPSSGSTIPTIPA
jgi:hypothetical protein